MSPTPHKVILGLGPAVVAEIDARLAAGISPGMVAKRLQARGHLPEVKHDTLKRALTRYRGAKCSEPRTPPLAELIALQAERLRKAQRHPFVAWEPEVRLMLELLRSSVAGADDA